VATYLTDVRKSLLVLLMGAVCLVAQSGRGVVSGTITDQSGGFVPKASATLTSTSTGAVRTATSNDSGIYYFGSLLVGPYHLTVTAPGFSTWETDFTLEAGQTLTVDASLKVGNVQSKVEVSDAAPMVSTEGSQISDIKTAKEIHDLPLNGRQITNLFSLTPGVEGGQNTQGASSPRTNGMMVGSTEILLDGMSYVDRFGGGMSRVQPGLDTVQEYRVETAGSGAAFDRPATIELVTRSGTNEFHGGAFETLRDNYGGLVARAIQDSNTPAKLIRNEFGWFVGGPVKRNKAFFFYDQELLKQRQQVFSQIAVPTAAMWNGDFSNAYADAAGDKITLYNPYTTNPTTGARQPFPGNIIPQNLLNTQVLNGFKSVTPLPSGPTANQNPWLGPNWEGYYPQNTDTNSITGRFDQVFSERNNLSVRYTQSLYDYLQTGGHYGYPPPGVSNATGSSAQKSNIINVTAHYTHTFSASLLNDFQASALRSGNTQGTGADNINWDAKLGLPNPFGATGWPTVYTDAYSMFYGGGWDSDNHKAQKMTQYELDDNVTWIKGKHSFKFGFKGRSEYNNVEELQQAQGSDFFDGSWTGLYNASAQAQTPFTGSGLASLELGIPGYLSNQFNRGFFYFKQKEFGIFGEDTWKITPKLTVSLGLRWNDWTPYKEKYNRMDTIDLNSLSPTSMQVVLPGNTTLGSIPGLPPAVIQAWGNRGLTAVSANSIHYPSALTPNVLTDFAPHLAVAYRLGEKWVLRGGYSTFYWPMPLSQILQSMRINPPLNLRYENTLDTQNGNNGVYSLTAIPTSADMLGAGGTATVSPSAVSVAAQSLLVLDGRNWNDDRMQEWTFTIERQLSPSLVMKLAYIGNHGSNLQQSWDENAPLTKYNYQLLNNVQAPTQAYQRQYDPNWNLTGQFGVVMHNGYSNSNSAQFILDKRYSNGLNFTFSYAYTHTMTTNDAGGFTFGGNGGINAVATGGGNQGGGSSGSVPAVNELLGAPNISDSARQRLLYTNSSQVPPQRITWTGLYQLPFGRGKKYLANTNRAVDALVGGWQIGFIGTWDGGFWMGNNAGEYQWRSPVIGSGRHITMNIFGNNQMLWFAGDFDPSQATNVNLAALYTYVPLNRADRAIHPAGANFDGYVNQVLSNGTVIPTNIGDNLSPNARNFMLGPKAWNQDLSAFKYFTITERVRLRMSGDFFNAFNHPLLNNPDATTGLINLSSQPNSPRIIQVGARLEF